jgi:hypothetical protein
MLLILAVDGAGGSFNKLTTSQIIRRGVWEHIPFKKSYTRQQVILLDRFQIALSNRRISHAFLVPIHSIHV